MCCAGISGITTNSSTICLVKLLSRFLLKPFGCSHTVTGIQLPSGYFKVRRTYPLTYIHRHKSMHEHLGHTHSRSNTHTREAAFCGLCQFWPAVSSLLHMYEGRDRTEHNQWACHCSSLPQKQLTHLYLTDEC